MNKKEFYAIKGCAGSDLEYEAIEAIKKISNLAKKHGRICVWYCNGTKSNPDYFRGEAHLIYDMPEYEKDIAKVETKILNLAKTIPGAEIKFQHDPRGWTVKLYRNGREISDCIHF